MIGLLDIYAKLVIAVVSFIAPLIVYLLSVSSDGIAIVREQATEQSNQLQQLLKIQISESKQFSSTMMKVSTQMLKELEKSTSRKSNLLNPKRQIIRIFSTLLGSLLFLMLYQLLKDPYFELYSHNMEIGILIASFICFALGVIVLKQVAWNSIETKKDIELTAKTRDRQKTKDRDDEIISPTA